MKRSNGTPSEVDNSEQSKKPRIAHLEAPVESNERSSHREAPVESKVRSAGPPQDLVESKEQRVRRRKVVLLLSYCGWGYLGMQRNPDAKTIEGDLLKALRNSNIITEEFYEKPQMMLFQRAARTDKGVSAVRQVVSLKLPETADICSINEHLPPQIRVVCMKRTTKGFNSKVNCDARTYSYVLPTYAFMEAGSEPKECFRISKDILERVNKVLRMYVGTHNFHNFTFKKPYKDPSAKRYIHSFSCGDPFVQDGIEFVTLTVKGQSFMQHHIRKMIGLTIAIIQGYTSENTILRAFGSESLDIPKAPGLGLMLEEVHYEGYNKRYGSDGVHEKLEWSQHEDFIYDFRSKFILSNILKTEKEERQMLAWMSTLSGHSYSLREEKPPCVGNKLPLAQPAENSACEAKVEEVDLDALPEKDGKAAGIESNEAVGV